ncbi:transferase [Armillaria borealis]|uniref:Transferase n=1 Tax=Armillaria borealis TaxID=47425 RepID=A0AA39MZ00_9AGAR|nr:transferase [Armillaria borealis]
MAVLVDIFNDSTSREFPRSVSSGERTVPLSIIDSTVGNFSPCEAVWFYDTSPSLPSTEDLKSTLRKTLDFYPQWCGRLHRLPNTIDRLALTFGSATDPGVLFVDARTNARLADLIPSPRPKAWDASGLPAAKFLPSTPVDPEGPAMLIQITTFACGGIAIGIRLAHPLSDAHTLAHFARDWGRIEHLLDAYAPGPEVDEALVREARKLPCNRYDWWISGSDFPFASQATVIPPGFDPPADVGGTRMPWSEWDISAPVSHYVLHFTRDEVKQMEGGTRMEAILAHVWGCINRARGLVEGDEVHMDLTFGLRPRLKLPDRFIGSPIMLADVRTPTAQGIRDTLSQFTIDALKAHLHEKKFEVAPQRLWQAFLGRRHVLVTSWVHTGVYEVGFGGLSPRYVEAVMPKLDGLLQVMEVQNTSGEHGRWYDAGVDLQLHLEEKAMGRLLEDPVLRKNSAA